MPAAVPPSTSAVAVTVSVLLRISPLVIKPLLAQRRLASVRSRTELTQGRVATLSACFHEILRRDAHWLPPSAWVFSTLTLRNSADGQPCDTGAIWPGCPLPQLNAPPRT